MYKMGTVMIIVRLQTFWENYGILLKSAFPELGNLDLQVPRQMIVL